MVYTLDTSGTVTAHLWRPLQGRRKHIRWSDLSPFAQGYIEALFEAARVDLSEGPDYDPRPYGGGFSDLAPETLARIIADCRGIAVIEGRTADEQRQQGRELWARQQAGLLPGLPPLTVQLDEGGLIRFAA